MRRVRTPDIARRFFSANELFGWEDGVRYDCTAPRERVKRRPPEKRIVVPPLLMVVQISGGREIS